MKECRYCGKRYEVALKPQHDEDECELALKEQRAGNVCLNDWLATAPTRIELIKMLYRYDNCKIATSKYADDLQGKIDGVLINDNLFCAYEATETDVDWELTRHVRGS